MRGRRRWGKSYAVRTRQQAGVPAAYFRLMMRTSPTALPVAVVVAGRVAGVLAIRTSCSIRDDVRQRRRIRGVKRGHDVRDRAAFGGLWIRTTTSWIFWCRAG